MIRNIDLVGQRFGKLVVSRKIGKNQRTGKTEWDCRCDCGKSTTRTTAKLRSGQTKSCGCWNFSHGMWRTGVFVSWKGMLNRCYRKTDISYKNYGGRGVYICDFLRQHPKNLLVVLGHRPDGLSLDRIDNEGNYTCGTCRDCLNDGSGMNIKWSTQKEQVKNKRNSRIVVLGGEKLSLKEISERYPISYNRLVGRWVSGFRDESILTPRIKGNCASNPKP